MNLFTYRAKRLDGKGWAVGFHDYNPIECCHIIHEVVDLPPTWNDPCGDVHSKWHEIDPSTLGVSWGMKDKDVDVFTGDILEDSGDMLEGCYIYKGVVVFSIERSEFCLQVGDSLHPIIQGDYYKLIGNIHDNPEIIEEE